MWFVVGVIAMVFSMSSPQHEGFQDQAPQSEVDCKSSAVDGRRLFAVHSYGGDGDFDIHSDDIGIHCRRPLYRGRTESVGDRGLLDHLTENCQRIVKSIKRQSIEDNRRAYIVYGLAASPQTAAKIKVALAQSLAEAKVYTLDQDPEPYWWHQGSWDTMQIKKRCESGAFEDGPPSKNRLFAYYQDKDLAELSAAYCSDRKWLTL